MSSSNVSRIRRNSQDFQRRINEASPFPSPSRLQWPSASNPPSKNKRCPQSTGSILLPDGWHLKEESEDGVIVYQVSREKAENEEEIFSTGLILSVTTKVPDRASVKPSRIRE